MVKQAESLWSDSRSQPHPLFENVPETSDSTRARLWLRRALALGAGAVAVVFLLYVFWLRAAPPLLFGPLGPVGAAEGRSDALLDGGFLALIDGLSPAPAEREETRPGESNAIGSKNRAPTTESDRDGGRESRESGDLNGVAAGGEETPDSSGPGREGQGSEPRRAPGADASDSDPYSGAGGETGSGGAPTGPSPGGGGDEGSGQGADDGDDDNGNGNGNGGGNGNGNGGGNGNGNGGGNGNGNGNGGGNGDGDDDTDEDDEDEDDASTDEDDEDDDEDDGDDEDEAYF